jgi:L-asparaginase
MPTFTWLLNSIRNAADSGTILMNVSQCPGGKVQMGIYETSVALIDAGVVSGQEITTEAAVTKLMFLLGQDLSNEKLKSCLKRNLRGEIDSSSL